MSKRAHDEELEDPVAKRARVDAPAGACWEDLVDDAKSLIRLACPLSTQRLLGMTCKAEHAVKTRPKPSPLKLARGLLVLGNTTLVSHVRLDGLSDTAFHQRIVHYALRYAPSHMVASLFDEFDLSICDVPCTKCFELCYDKDHHEEKYIDERMVDLLFDAEQHFSAETDAIKSVLRVNASDELFGRFCKRFE